MSRTTTSIGRVKTLQADVFSAPKRAYAQPGTVPGVIYTHPLSGFGVAETMPYLAPGEYPIFDALRQQYCVGMGDFDLNAWGNDTAIADVLAMQTWMQSTMGAKSGKVVLVGASMGTTTALNYARAYPGNVACVAANVPALNLTSNPAFAPTVNAAYGTPAFDAVGAGNHALLTSAGITDSITLGSTASAVLVAVANTVSGDTYANVTSNSCMIGSTPMSLLGVVSDGNTASGGWTEVWGATFAAGTLTGAQTITYKEAAGASFPFSSIQTFSYKGVGSFGTAVTNFGTSTSLTTGAVASAPGNIIFAAMSGENSANPLTKTGPGTQRANPTGLTGSYVNLLVQDVAGGTTQTLTATLPISFYWGTVAIPLQGVYDPTVFGATHDPSVYAASFPNIPVHLWYSTADTTAYPAAVDAFVAACPSATKTVVSTTLNHGQAAIAATPIADIMAFIQSHLG